MSLLLRVLLLLLSLIAAGNQSCAAQPAQPLTSLSEVQSISHDVAKQNLPVRITGVVTYIDRGRKRLFIQDGEQVSFVEIDETASFDVDVDISDRIEITGRTRAGRVTPVIHAEAVRRLGTATLPAPIPVETQGDFEAQNWNRLVELKATVYRTYAEKGRGFLQVSADGFAASVGIRFLKEPHSVWRWRGQPVRIRGILTEPDIDDRERPHILAIATQVELLNPEAERSTAPLFVEVASLPRLNGNASKLTQVVAQAISDSNSDELILRDWSGSVRVVAEDLPDIRLGDVVTVKGRTTGESHGLPLFSGEVSRIGPGKPVVPETVDPANAIEHAFEFVSLQGVYRGLSQQNESDRAVLEHGDTHFTVSGPKIRLAPFRDLNPESMVRVTGVCRLTPDQPFAFDVLSHQIDVLYESPIQPRTEPARRSPFPAPPPGVELPPPPGPDPIGPLIVTGVSLFMMLVMLVSFLVLLRRSREQQTFYATIHEQLNEVSHISRLNTLAEMVGALAHELNQPLASVTNFAETARILGERGETASPQMQEILERIATESLRAGEIIRRLRTLVQKKTPGHIRTSINQVVQDSLDMFRMRELVTNGTLDVQLADDLADIKVDPVQLEQVILNFLLNARDATKELEGRLPKIVVTTARDDGHVIVSVEDNGPGIASSDPAAVFEPYFTTKSNGMGLGLAICRTIVESHNGSIAAENVEPHGAKLTVRLPVAESRDVRSSE
ncbi:MAG: sensor histidine kinase [Planctomycetota bacterium]|jgi:signal transduction histidine kinase